MYLCDKDEYMKIALVQIDTLWEQKQNNLTQIAKLLNRLKENVDIIVLPEMFTTGFSMNPSEIAEAERGDTLQFTQELAVKHQCAIVGSWVTKENEKYYNRLYFVLPDGKYFTYNKKHLFSLAGEEKFYTSGNEKIIISYKNWNICPLVCYDLRFPVYSRIVEKDYDLLLYIASWPDKRIYAWDTLLKARAIENMSYVIGVNRCGTDPNNVFYSGHSQAVNYMGEYMINPFENEGIKIVTLEKTALEKAREKLGFLNDADNFTLSQKE